MKISKTRTNQRKTVKMAHEKRRRMNVQIEYGSLAELKLVFESVIGQTMHGKTHERKLVAGAFYEMFQEIIEDETNYREEVINGKLCLIIKSSI